ncbi:MAG TPA: trypsin-like peptidase domain-containing protein [Gaiellaceae bacterium]|jgi:putative serine protease PepD|nr:trypsin-like peptidase domain-containing protein [Gaiellaceae bacterium]
MKRRPTALLVAGLVAALALGVGLGATAYSTVADGTTTVVREVSTSARVPTATTEGLTIGEIYEQTHEGVVEITAGGSAARAQGSGFVYDDAGHVVTNQHVVEGASSLSVLFWDGSRHSARLVGTDPSTDLAVIEVEAPQALLDPLRLGDSGDVAVGDQVVAMGSPFGLEGTVTSGIVSALHRQMTAPNNFPINDSIQTDAAINHGNSGGPLLDGQGRVIGVNAQIESESGGNDGVGFAIPSDTVRSIVTQLIESGEVEHAYLGIKMLDVADGAAITEVVPGTPADDAGLRPATGTSTIDGQEVPTGGDVIVAFDGDDVSSSAALQSAVEAKQPGDEVSITVLRGAERTTLRVTLGTRPS